MSNNFTIAILGFRRSEHIIIDCFLKKEAIDKNHRYNLVYKAAQQKPHIAFINTENFKLLDEKKLGQWIDYLDHVPCIFSVNKDDDQQALIARFRSETHTVVRPLNFGAIAAMMSRMIYLLKKEDMLEAEDQSAYTVLVVDDSRSLRLDMKLKLEPIGIEVDLAEDANQALREIGNKNYHLVFMDIMMPGGMDGFEACSTIKKLYPDLPVVMLTSKDGMFSKVRGRMAKCDGYVVKPASLIDLKEVFEAHVFNR